MQKSIFLYILFQAIFNVFLLPATNILNVNAKTIATVSKPNIWSPFGNAATIMRINNAEASLLYQNYFGLKELSTKAAQIGFHTRPVNVGLAFSSFGYSNYNENMLGLSLGRKFSKNFMLGIQFDYYFVHFSKTEGNKGVLFPQIGILSQPTEALYIGFQAFNPIQAKIKTMYIKKEIPSIFSIGGSYLFTKKFTGSILFEKEIQANLRIATEFDYQLIDYFSIKLGCRKNEIFVPSGGIGFKAIGFEVDTNFFYHSQLGIIPAIALTYKLK